ETLVQHLRERREAVRRARGVGDDVMLGRVVRAFVHAEDDGDVLAFRGRRDDHLLGAGREMLGGRIAVREQPRRLEHDVDAEILPRQLGRIPLRQHLELVAVHRNSVRRGGHGRVDVAEHRVVLEQMGERRGVRQIVDVDEIDVLIAERGAHYVAADAAKSVDSNPHRHRRILQAKQVILVNFFFFKQKTAYEMYLLYSVLSLFVFMLVSPYFLYQAIRYKKYIGNLRERLGYLPISFNVDGDASIWIHAVSVGEALTARAVA